MSFLAGAIIGFRVVNFHPRVFMGSTGVVFVGTMPRCFRSGTAVAAALLVLGVPIIDTFYVLVRRMEAQAPPFA
jgi:UDP-N-acetylmuramyl pentapeptide phosphotransferase/UDP-N-acetylglucosamine-1-phosphate transferase